MSNDYDTQTRTDGDGTEVSAEAALDAYKHQVHEVLCRVANEQGLVGQTLYDTLDELGLPGYGEPFPGDEDESDLDRFKRNATRVLHEAGNRNGFGGEFDDVMEAAGLPRRPGR
jgi:hypothetical protein